MGLGAGIVLSTLIALSVWQIGKHKKWAVVGLWTIRSVLALAALGACIGGYQWLQSQRLEAEARQRNEREAAARPCLANDIPRMESAIFASRAAINQSMTIEQARETLARTLDPQASIVVSNDSIRDLVAVASIYTKCDSDFNLLVNVTARNRNSLGSGEPELKFFGVWPQNAPIGYAAPNFNLDYDQQRELARKQAEALARAATRTPARATATSPTDHCAPNLSKAERLERLAAYGDVREVGYQTFQAGTHRVEFAGGVVFSCY